MPKPGSRRPPGTTRMLRGALRAFLRGERGGAAIEAALALAVLVVGFAGLMEIVEARYTDDRMSRAAHAAARALALNPGGDSASVACAAIRREFRLADDFDCATEWTVTVDLGVSPSTLPATLGASVTAGTGDMVLVRLGWNRESWSLGSVPREASSADTVENSGDGGSGTESESEDGGGSEDEGTARAVPVVAVAVARCESELCGQQAG